MLCAWIVKQGDCPGGGQFVQRCQAAAMERSNYCRVHQDLANGVRYSAPPRMKRDLTLDELPWTEKDRAVFSGHQRSTR